MSKSQPQLQNQPSLLESQEELQYEVKCLLRTLFQNYSGLLKQLLQDADHETSHFERLFHKIEELFELSAKIKSRSERNEKKLKDLAHLFELEDKESFLSDQKVFNFEGLNTKSLVSQVYFLKEQLDEQLQKNEELALENQRVLWEKEMLLEEALSLKKSNLSVDKCRDTRVSSLIETQNDSFVQQLELECSDQQQQIQSLQSQLLLQTSKSQSLQHSYYQLRVAFDQMQAACSQEVAIMRRKLQLKEQEMRDLEFELSAREEEVKKQLQGALWQLNKANEEIPSELSTPRALEQKKSSMLYTNNRQPFELNYSYLNNLNLSCAKDLSFQEVVKYKSATPGPLPPKEKEELRTSLRMIELLWEEVRRRLAFTCYFEADA